MTGAISTRWSTTNRRLKVRYVRSTSSSHRAKAAPVPSSRPASDSTRCGLAALEFEEPGTWINPGSGTMGFGVPPRSARRWTTDRTVWCIDGDGCFQMTARS